jgi:transposase
MENEAFLYPESALERAMEVRTWILKAASGEITWLRAADILDVDPRTMLRWRRRYEQHGCAGLLDRRRQRPSDKRVPLAEVQHILRLYREKYPGFNVRHFHQIARREHQVTRSYTFVRMALQIAGLIPRQKARGKHRRRREPRPCFGEMLHIDGSPHEWLALRPGERQTMIPVVDDATSKLLYAQLWQSEGTHEIMTALEEVFGVHGLPSELYSDRASWAAWTPKAGEQPDRSRLTQVGRALKQLGVQHILAHSPQARGRSERLNRTLQDRLVNELRSAGIRTVEAANRYIRQNYLPQHNQDFSHAPSDPSPAFVPVAAADLDRCLCHEETRIVARDNTVAINRLHLQLDKQPGRRSCAGLEVTVRQHLDGRHTVSLGRRLLGAYDSGGKPLETLPSGRNSASGYARRSVAAAACPASP